jgi:histidinol-phosphate aminotransferase
VIPTTRAAITASNLVRPGLAAIAGYVPGEQPQSGDWIKLNTNENPYAPSPRVAAAVTELLSGRTLAKYPDPLATRFREQAAALHGVDPDWILCGNGSDDLLTILVRSFVGEGEWLRMAYPSYILYRTLAQLQGAACDEHPFARDWSLDDGFAAPATPSGTPLRLAILANPNSPSGTCLAPQRVAELARQLPCPLVVDEAYGDFADSDCVGLVRTLDRVIVTRSLSKSYALAGIRFGYAIARPEFVEQLVKMKDSYNCDALSIAAATAALLDREWLAATRARLLATRARLTAGLRTLGFTVVDSQANFVWCTHADRPHRALYEALKARRILVRCMDYAGWGDGLRITVGTDAEIDALLAALRTL